MREPKLVNKITAKCPSCGEYSLEINDYIYDEVPGIGGILLSVGRCSKCGYRFNDVRALESQGPVKISLTIEKAEDLNILVLKSAMASIKMPELGVEIKAGPASQGFITTVEGFLLRVIDIIKFLCGEPEVDKAKCRERLIEVENALRGEKKFTLIIIDREGWSRVFSDKAVVEPLAE